MHLTSSICKQEKNLVLGVETGPDVPTDSPCPENPRVLASVHRVLAHPRDTLIQSVKETLKPNPSSSSHKSCRYFVGTEFSPRHHDQ